MQCRLRPSAPQHKHNSKIPLLPRISTPRSHPAQIFAEKPPRHLMRSGNAHTAPLATALVGPRNRDCQACEKFRRREYTGKRKLLSPPFAGELISADDGVTALLGCAGRRKAGHTRSEPRHATAHPTKFPDGRNWKPTRRVKTRWKPLQRAILLDTHAQFLVPRFWPILACHRYCCGEK